MATLSKIVYRNIERIVDMVDVYILQENGESDLLFEATLAGKQASQTIQSFPLISNKTSIRI